MEENQNPAQPDPVQSSQAPIPPIPPSLNENKRKLPVPKIALLGIVFIILIAIIGGAYFLDNNKAIKQFTGLTPNPCGNDAKICPAGNVVERTGPKCEFSVCEEASVDVTKIWQVAKSSKTINRTYINSNLGFSFEAPRDWRFEGRDDNGFNLYSPNFECHHEFMDVNMLTCTGSDITLLTTLKTNRNSIEEWFNSKDTYYINPAIFEKPKYINIAGTRALELRHKAKLSIITYYFLKNGIIYGLYFNPSSKGKDGPEIYKPVFSQILSTFKFTNQDPAADTTTWKTYSNSRWKYSLKYPIDWNYLENVENSVKFSNNKITNTLNKGDISLEINVKSNSSIQINGSGSCFESMGQDLSNNSELRVGNIFVKKFLTDPAKTSVNQNYIATYIIIKDRCYIFNFQTSDSQTRKNFDSIMDQMLYSFKFTNNHDSKTVNLESEDQHIYLQAPPDSIVINRAIDADIIINESRFQIFITPDPEQYCIDSCTHVDEEYISSNPNLKINHLRIWKNNEGMKMLNPQSILLNNGLSIEGIVIRKKVPNTIITPEEVQELKKILDTISTI